MLQSEALLLAQKNMLHYFQTHDVSYIADDAVFRNMATGETYHGRAEIGGMLHYIYQVAFTARGEMTNYIITENKALVEGFFTGVHTGDFAGMQPTGKEVKVPICVSYDLQNGLIKEARIYMLTDVLMQQLR